MPKDVVKKPDLIDAGAVLTLAEAVETAFGIQKLATLLSDAGFKTLPAASEMIPEEDAARLHRQLCNAMPEDAKPLKTTAGQTMARQLLAQEIPKPAQSVLRAFPQMDAAHGLAGIIARRANLFAGSGTFRAIDPWMFELWQNPLTRSANRAYCGCHWQAAIIAQLYQTLIGPRYTCVETCCGTEGNGDICRFVIRETASTTAPHRPTVVVA